MTALLPTQKFHEDAAQPPPVWQRPDPALAAAGIEGEMVVAKVRMLAMALLLMAPTWNIIHYPHEPMHITGFSVTLAAWKVISSAAPMRAIARPG